MMKLFVTGGCGFIGSNYIRKRFEEKPLDEIMNYDLLTYAGNLENLEEVQRSPLKYSFERGDICDRERVLKLLKTFKPDVIVNFAAESHNSYSILNPGVFFRTNTLGTQNLLDCARLSGVDRFHQVSTCEVYGDMSLEDDSAFTERSPYQPKTVYNASKASADHAVRAYHNVFGLNTTISICSNNYGPYQYPEKLIPLFLTNIFEGKKMPLYKSSSNKREWLHVDDHCRAIDMIIANGVVGETYNVGSSVEKSIEEIADLLIELTQASAKSKNYVDDRPGHDRRYLLDSGKIRRELGWVPEKSFEEGIKSTVEWYRANTGWWKSVKDKKPVDETSW
ncbi:dTDP-glucose 4,6-dehydratase [candidate division WOR-3 bacterium]|nr:dTDP-glucose 4,6-dehydratase [candidate division WOR-3 bacterium]